MKKLKVQFTHYIGNREVTIKCQCDDIGFDWTKGFNFVILENEEIVSIPLDDIEQDDIETECISLLMERKSRMENGRGYEEY